MKKENIKFVLILVAVFIAGMVIMYFITGGNESPEEVPDEAADQIETLLSTMPENDERMKVIGKTEDEIVKEFEAEKEACLNIYGDEEELLENGVQAGRYYTCKAVKEGDAEVCSSLEEDYPAERSRCERTYDTYANVIFPAIEAGSCTEEVITACEDSEDPEVGPEDCANLCGGLVEKDAQGCNNIESPLHRNMCLTVAEEDTSYCEQMSGENAKNCEDQYYFYQAIETGNEEHLENIQIEYNYMLARLFMNEDESCSEILNSKNQEFCNSEYSESRLENRIELGRELSDLEENFDINVEEYIQ